MDLKEEQDGAIGVANARHDNVIVGDEDLTPEDDETPFGDDSDEDVIVDDIDNINMNNEGTGNEGSNDDVTPEDDLILDDDGFTIIQ